MDLIVVTALVIYTALINTQYNTTITNCIHSVVMIITRQNIINCNVNINIKKKTRPV